MAFVGINADVRTHFRPTISDIGLKKSGPVAYANKKIDSVIFRMVGLVIW